MGRHVGHSFIYLQDALQDSRTLTIQLLADAQQGRQAIQVRYSQLKYFISPSFFSPPPPPACLLQGKVSRQKALCFCCQSSHPFCFLRSLTEVVVELKIKCCYMSFAFLQHNPVMQITIYMKLCTNALECEAFQESSDLV